MIFGINPFPRFSFLTQTLQTAQLTASGSANSALAPAPRQDLSRRLFLGSSLGLVSGLWGCGKKEASKETAPSRTSTPPVFDFSVERRESIDVKGDAKYGSIVHLHQTHQSQSTDLQDKYQLASLCVNQFYILKELEALNARHLFLEGWTDATVADRKKWEANPDLRQALKLFRDLPSDHKALTEDQIYVLTYAPAAMIHFLRHKDAVFHETESAALNREMRTIIGAMQAGGQADAQGIVEPSADFIRIQDERENFALNSILKFLKTSPREVPALIYGSAHNFGPNLLRIEKTPPRLTSISWNLPEVVDPGSAEIPEPA